MVAKAVRCSACRMKKVKCDQQWPQCGQCQRGKRKCSGPPQRVKFISIETSYPGPHGIFARKERHQTSQGKPLAWAPEFENNKDDNEAVDTASDTLTSDYAPNTDFELVPPMSTTPALRIASHLISLASATHSPFLLGSFVEYTPAMLQSSKALTAAAACCVDACSRNELLPRKSRTLHAGLYGKALNAIHQALDSPDERTNITTFLAIALMQRLETTFVSSREIANIPCWSVHAGGISELLKYRGVFDPNEGVVFNTVLENFGPIVSHSVYREEDCFLATPEWQPIFALRSYDSTAHGLLCMVFSQLAFLPGLIRRIRAFKRGENTFSEAMDTAISVTNTLDWVGKGLEERILPNLAVRAADLSCPGTPVAEMYVTDDEDILRLISWHAVLSIMVNNIVITLSGSDLTNKAQMELRSRNLLLSTRIWMLSDEARRFGLIRYYFIIGAIANTYESARSQATRQWIVDLLSDIHGFDRRTSPWKHETVQRACDTLAARI